MTDIATREDHAVAVPERPATDLELWAHEARQVSQIAQSLAATNFVPASLRGKPGDITAAILAGREMGLKPMATLKSIDIIQGTPALRAHAMRALVQAHGHSVQLVESDNAHCVMRGRRDGETDWQTVTWTVARAQQLGLTGKDQWKKQPQTMLIARATGEICRLIASDVLYAMPYVAEELRDHEAPAQTQRVTAAEILGLPAASGEPEQPEGPTPTVDAEPGAEDDWPPVPEPGGE